MGLRCIGCGIGSIHGGLGLGTKAREGSGWVGLVGVLVRHILEFLGMLTCYIRCWKGYLNGHLSNLHNALKGSFFLLYACTHNPTRIDPTKEQWQEIS